MKLEVIKSYTLAILVGISLILSFSLWSYQPKDGPPEEEKLLNEEQIDLGGEVESRKTLVQPTKIIFDVNGEYYGFSNSLNMQALYKDMESWVLYNFRTSEANGRPNDESLIEVIYPVALPMPIISTLFTVNNSESVNANLPENISFQRMYITRNKYDQSLTFIFLSTDGKTQIKADVNNAQKYDLLANYMDTLENLEKYTVLTEEEFPIYLPANPIQTSSYRFNVVDGESFLEPEKLKNALFLNPHKVFENMTDDQEIWYQDGIRLMRVFKNRLNMEYVNPDETLSNPITFLELLDMSIARINGYKGWVQDYQLETINTGQKFIRYQMYYRGYPVFNHAGLSTIEQLWENNELEEHRQPLFTINNTASESYDLPSGENVISHIKNTSTYNIEEVEDIQVGYRLSINEIESETITLSLTPAWYIKTNGEWKQIILDEELERKGVS